MKRYEEGREAYERWRTAMNRAHRRRAHFQTEPRWKDLKPWVMRVWYEAAQPED